MTTTKRRVCDNCGQEIKGETRRINIRGDLAIYGPAMEKDVDVNKDLCLDCARESFDMNVIAVPIEPKAKVDFEAT